MPTATTHPDSTVPTLHLALDLGNSTWKLAFATAIAHAPKQHHIGLDGTADGVWSIYLGPVLLARLDERDHIIRG